MNQFEEATPAVDPQPVPRARRRRARRTFFPKDAEGGSVNGHFVSQGVPFL